MVAGLKEGRTQTQSGLPHVTVKTEVRVLYLYTEDSKASPEYYRSTHGTDIFMALNREHPAQTLILNS